ncbi:MAG TPA: roadblock/LC7 domain-containing protein [Candidatus Thermoplasmatota archaeon]|nr:roadblock/LC7 domain-containing protein [Candidatus Thermoplasmatota archaeon]
MSDARSSVQASLERRVGPTGWLGAALVSRDGLPVMRAFSRPVNEETFSAMVAAMMGAAEAAWAEWGEDRPQRALLEGAKLRLAVLGLDTEYILAVAAPVKGEGAAFLKDVDAAAAELRTLLKG